MLREQNAHGFEVFLLKRHEQNIFMGGNFVYPGGRLDKGDGDQGIIALSRGISTDQAFEEAGILLAYTRDGQLLSIDSDDMRQRFNLHRKTLQKGQQSFLQIVKEEGLTLALDKCFYYAHWITPEARNVRFDARFFIAHNVPGQEASPDAKETTEGVWLSPAEALAKNLIGTVALSPPTLKTLEDLSRFNTINDLLLALPDMGKPTVLPILLGSPSGLSDNTTRLVLKDGRWLPYVKTGG